MNGTTTFGERNLADHTGVNRLTGNSEMEQNVMSEKHVGDYDESSFMRNIKLTQQRLGNS